LKCVDFKLTSLTISINSAQTFTGPLGILQYCKRLVILELEGITLPFYAADSDLPLVQTLRKRTLIQASIGWMSGRTFAVLKECRVLVTNPDPRDELKMTHFPVCTLLEYVSRPTSLNLLARFRAPHLRSLVAGPFVADPPVESCSRLRRFKFPWWWGALTDELESISGVEVTESQLVWPGQTTKRGLEMYTLVAKDPVYADDLMDLPFTHLGTGLRADEALASWK